MAAFSYFSDNDSDIARNFGSLAKSGGGWKSDKQAGYWFSQFERDDKHRAEYPASSPDYDLIAFEKAGFKLEEGQRLLSASGVLRFNSSHHHGLTGVGAKGLTWFFVVDGKGLVRKIKAGHGESGQGLVNIQIQFERENHDLPDHWAVIHEKREKARKIREAEYLAAEVAPEGRVEITGEVVKDPEWRSQGSRPYGGEFGALKTIVKDDRGFKVWVSVPSREEWKRGDRVQFTATLTPSEDDPKFAFGKRPTVKKEKAS